MIKRETCSKPSLHFVYNLYVPPKHQYDSPNMEYLHNTVLVSLLLCSAHL